MPISDDLFNDMVSEAIDRIPEDYGRKMKNVAFVAEDVPTEEQRAKLGLCEGETLFGLYEGIPLTKRTNNYSLVLPDKITIFKLPLLAASSSPEDLRKRVIHTVWHEVAHHFGLGHDRIHEIEQRMYKHAN